MRIVDPQGRPFRRVAGFAARDFIADESTVHAVSGTTYAPENEEGKQRGPNQGWYQEPFMTSRRRMGRDDLPETAPSGARRGLASSEGQAKAKRGAPRSEIGRPR